MNSFGMPPRFDWLVELMKDKYLGNMRSFAETQVKCSWLYENEQIIRSTGQLCSLSLESEQSISKNLSRTIEEL
jgi:hypothetical protein